ncbi:MAG: hypothetical protein AB7T63_01535 [Planctomycetota bacterium]
MTPPSQPVQSTRDERGSRRQELRAVLLGAAVLAAGLALPGSGPWLAPPALAAPDSVGEVGDRIRESLRTATSRGQWEGALRALTQSSADDRPTLYRSVVLGLLDEARQPDRPPRMAELAAYLVRHVLEDLPRDERVGAALRRDLETCVLMLVGSDDLVAERLEAELLTDPTDGSRPGHDRLLEVSRQRLEDPASTREDVESAVHSLAREGRGPGGRRVPDVVALLARRWRTPVGPMPDPAVWQEAFSRLLDVPFPDAESVGAFFAGEGATADLMRRLDSFQGWDGWTDEERMLLDRDLRAMAAWQASERPTAGCLPDETWELAVGWATELINKASSPEALLPFWSASTAGLPRHEVLQRLAADRAKRLVTNGPAPMGKDVEKAWDKAFAAAVLHVVDPPAIERILGLVATLKPSAPENGAAETGPWPQLADALVVRFGKRAAPDTNALRRQLINLVPTFGGPKHGLDMVAAARKAHEAAQGDEGRRAETRGLLTFAIEVLPRFPTMDVANLEALLAGAETQVRVAVATALGRDGISRGPHADRSFQLLRALVLGPPAGGADGLPAIPLPDPEHAVRVAALRSLDAYSAARSSAALAAAVLTPPADEASGRADEALLAVDLLGRKVRLGDPGPDRKPAAEQLIQVLGAPDETGFAKAVRLPVVAVFVESLAQLDGAQRDALAQGLIRLLGSTPDDATELLAAVGGLASKLGRLDVCTALFARAGLAGETSATWLGWTAAALGAFAEEAPEGQRAARDGDIAAFVQGLSSTDETRLRLLRALGASRGAATWTLTSTVAVRMTRADPVPALERRLALLKEALQAEEAIPAPAAANRARERAALRLQAAGLAAEAVDDAEEAKQLRLALGDALQAKDATLAQSLAPRMERLAKLMPPEEFAKLAGDLEALKALASS